MSVGDLAFRLVAVRAGAAPIENVPEDLAPRDITQAYAVADLVVAALELSLGRIAGYKIGATTIEGQKILGLLEPFYGRTFERNIVASGQEWNLAGRLSSVEPEIGFLLVADLPPRSTPHSMPEVRAAVGLVMPLLEINRPAYARPFEVGGLCLVADNGVTQGFVRGGPGLQLDGCPDLSLERVTLTRNGVACGVGLGSVVLGDPLNALLWLANALRVQGRGLKAGDCVASGAMTSHVAVSAGDIFEAEYSTLGKVSMRAIWD